MTIEEAAQLALSEQAYARERARDGSLKFTADDPACPDVMRLAALAEELGEVARCLHDHDDGLEHELIQLAGIALAWATVPRQVDEAHALTEGGSRDE